MKELRILVAVGVLALLTVAGAMAAKPGTSPEENVKLFYLTAMTYQGDSVLTPGVCAAGYHVASRWEFRDLAGLEYALDEPGAYIADDQGVGPPVLGGWVRSNNNSTRTGSSSNCSLWTSTSSTDFGVRMAIGGTGAPTIYSSDVPCLGAHPVWCMQD